MQNTLIFLNNSTLPWFSSSVAFPNSAQGQVLSALVDLATSTHPSQVLALLDLSWIRAGVFTGLELDILPQLALVADHEVFDAIHAAGWLEGGLDGPTFAVLPLLLDIASQDEVAAMRILGLPFLDTIEPDDEVQLAALRGLAHASTEVLRVVLDKPWLQHPIEDELIGIAGTDVLHNLSALAKVSEVMALRLAKSTFLDETPLAAAWELTGRLQSMARFQETLFDSIMSKPWREDILDDDRIWMLPDLYIIGQQVDENTAVRIINSPFLDTVEPIDRHIVHSLWWLHTFASPEAFEQAMTHPAIGGQPTAGFAEVLAMMRSVEPHLFDRMLDPSKLLIEQRTVVLPLKGELKLTIVRTRPGAEASMDRLEATVRMVEEFMDVPFPIDFVTVYYDEGKDEDGSPRRAVNFEHSIALPAEQDNIMDRSPGIRAHEVAHYYFGRLIPEWLAEGTATIIERLGDGALPDRLDPMQALCTEVETLAEFDYLYVKDRDALRGLDCQYSLGDRLFVDLYNALGETAFRRGLRELYLMRGRLRSAGNGEVVAEAFKANAPEQSVAIDAIVERWYGNAPATEDSSDSTN